MSKYNLPIIQELRAIKNSSQINHITRAQRLNEKILSEVIKKVKEGVREIDLARLIVKHFKRSGVAALAFEPIVAFGRGSADIHHWPTSARLKKNQIVMLDFGATSGGYCSDMTRTFWFGQPSAKFKRVYLTVLTAQTKALKLLASGERRAKIIDSSARKFIHRQFGRSSFTHGLGHGVGTAIHEWPNLKPTSTDILTPGMVITIEPGIYLPGWGGVRIEDLVVIKQSHIHNLTLIPKDLSSVIIPAR